MHRDHEPTSTEYRLLVEHSPVMIWRSGVDAQCDYFNATWLAFTGRSLEQELGAGWAEGVHPDDCERCVAYYLDHFARREPFEMEYRLRHRDGTYHWIFDRGVPYNDDTGTFAGFIGSCVDIEERRRLQEYLRQQAEQKRESELADIKLLHEVSKLYIHDDDSTDLYSRISDATAAIMHSDCASLQIYEPSRGRAGVLCLLASTGLDEELKQVWASVEPGPGTICGAVFRTGRRMVVPDLQNCDEVRGTLYEAAFARAGFKALQATPLYSRDGQLLGMLSNLWRRQYVPTDRDLRLLDILSRLAADLIERRNAEEALRQTQAALKEADRRKDEFLATLAHELRNPLAPIINALSILQHAPDSPRRSQLAQMMERQANHLVRLIDDLLDVARVSQGKVDLRRERMALRTVVQAAVEASQHQLDVGKHRLMVDMPEQPVMLFADPTRIAQVISNLLTNAAKYTPEGGRIALSAQVEGDTLVLKVKDNGMGIPADMISGVFDMFAQVDVNRHRAQGGLGIGLALVKRLLELHGGSIRAESPGVGQGATFIVMLPLAPAERPAHDAQNTIAVRPRRASSKGMRVLVVDDNIPAAQTTSWMLEAMGHKLKQAYGSDEAREAASTFLPEVILLDIGMKGTNGYELCRELRKDARFGDTLIIAQTGWAQERDRQLALEAGFNHHIVKPIDFEHLASLLGSATKS